MSHLNKNKTGLAVGSLYAFFHFMWVSLVALNIAKPLMDWILSLHFLSLSYEINSFQLMPAALLILITFVLGYLMGWFFAVIWNHFHS